MSADNIFALCASVAAVFFFFGYFSGKSDEKDAENRRQITKNCSRNG